MIDRDIVHSVLFIYNVLLLLISILIFDNLNNTVHKFNLHLHGGSKYFEGGPDISEIYGPGGPNISKYLDRGEQKRGGPNLS